LINGFFCPVYKEYKSLQICDASPIYYTAYLPGEASSSQASHTPSPPTRPLTFDIRNQEIVIYPTTSESNTPEMTLQGPIFQRGTQVKVHWDPYLAGDKIKLFIDRLVENSQTHQHTWQTWKQATLSKDPGEANLLMDTTLNTRTFPAGVYRLSYTTNLAPNGKSPYCYLKVVRAQGTSPRFAFSLSDLRTTPQFDYRGWQVTLTNRGSTSFHGPIVLKVYRDDIFVGEFLANGLSGEHGYRTFFATEEMAICSCSSHAKIKVVLPATDIWEEKSIERTLRVPNTNCLPNISFDGAHSIQVSEDNEFVTVHARVKVTTKSGSPCKNSYLAALLISKPDAHLLTFRTRVNIESEEITFRIPSPVLNASSGGEKNLYFEIVLDAMSEWDESDERDIDNRQQIRYHLH